MKTNKILLTFYPLISNYPFHNLCQYKKIPTLKSTFLSWYLKWVLTMAPPVGLEPTTHGLTVRRSTDWAKGECLCWHYLSSRAVTRQVLSALVSLTSVFGMGTGGPSQQSIPTHMDGSSPSFIVKSLPASNRFILAHPVLPVNCFLPELLVTRTGFEPMLKAWEASVLTTWPTGHGAPSRTRTGDPLIKSQLLYQLS